MAMPPLVPGKDYYIDEKGRYVFTAQYLLARGECCYSGCRHCPYGFAIRGNADDESRQVKAAIVNKK